jgi:hypothetical protein
MIEPNISITCCANLGGVICALFVAYWIPENKVFEISKVKTKKISKQ